MLYIPNMHSCVFKSYQEIKKHILVLYDPVKQLQIYTETFFLCLQNAFSFDSRLQCSFMAETLILSGQTWYKKGSAISSSKPETPYSAHSRFIL